MDLPASLVEDAQQEGTEVDVVPTLADGLEADVLSTKDHRGPQGPVMPAYTPPHVGLSHFEMGWVLDFGRPARVGPGRGDVHLARGPAVERAMGPHRVVLGHEPREAPLLGGQIAGGRPRGATQSPVHSLVTPVLVGTTRLNAHRLDPQLHPPHSQARQTRQTRGSKGRSRITQDLMRQTVGPEGLLEHGPYQLIGVGQSTAARQ